jgi:hypothetical protein
MSTEFNDDVHYGLFFGGGPLNSSTSFKVRQSELTLAALRSAGLLDNMVDGLVPPTVDKLWLDKNFDPAVLREWNAAGANWQEVTSRTLFGSIPWAGVWQSSQIYRPGDVVSYTGNIWIAAQSNQNHPPAEDAYWDVFIDGTVFATAAQGAKADSAVQPGTPLLAALEAVAASLPTTLPGSAGKLWNNGGLLSIS